MGLILSGCSADKDWRTASRDSAGIAPDPAESKEAILQVTKDKLELRFKKATKQSFKPHLFQYNRCRLAQLLTVQEEVSKKSSLI